MLERRFLARPGTSLPSVLRASSGGRPSPRQYAGSGGEQHTGESVAHPRTSRPYLELDLRIGRRVRTVLPERRCPPDLDVRSEPENGLRRASSSEPTRPLGGAFPCRWRSARTDTRRGRAPHRRFGSTPGSKESISHASATDGSPGDRTSRLPASSIPDSDRERRRPVRVRSGTRPGGPRRFRLAVSTGSQRGVE